MVTLLTHSHIFLTGARPKYFSHREFSFTLKDDVYIRYQSFSDQKDMEKEIQKRCPYKIDIGAVFSQKVEYSIVSKIIENSIKIRMFI